MKGEWVVDEWHDSDRSKVRVPAASVAPDGKSCSQERERWTCTRRPNHNGRHAASTYDGEVWAVWR